MHKPKLVLFNTKDFALFFAIILAVYWLVWRWQHVRNVFLLLASGYFYYRFRNTLPFYLYSIIGVSYLSGLVMSRTAPQGKRKALLTATIVILGLGLAYIKYSGLLLGNIPGMTQWQASAMHIITPIGISYFTFSTIGYITDVYRRTIVAETNFIVYASYISYFPHILCGPIASAAGLLPQFKNPVKPTIAVIEASVAEILWGLYKKMVVADNIAVMVNYCFANYKDQTGSTLFLGVTLFSFFIYADFSGYSEIARGTSRLLGIELVKNFKMPFFSRNPGEMWRRWHTSLRKWMLDYIYLPLGGAKVGKTKYMLIIFFIFCFSGLWHGANITFVCWGVLNGLYFFVYLFSNSFTRYKDLPGKGKLLPNAKELLQMFITFNLATIMRIFFRSPNMEVATGFFMKIMSASMFAPPLMVVVRKYVWCLPMLAIEWVQREKDYVLQLPRVPAIARIGVYLLLISAIWYFCPKQSATECYYFKF